MYCSKCGKQIPDTSTFCLFCGNQVSASQIISKPQVNLAQQQTSVTKREEARKYNKLSWIFFAAALLIGFAGSLEISSILVVAAVILSVLYHVKK